MEEIVLLGVGYIALITAVVQVFKTLGLKSDYAPLAAVALGVVSAFGLVDISVSSAFSGIASGLVAVGLYDIGGRAVVRAVGGK